MNENQSRHRQAGLTASVMICDLTLTVGLLALGARITHEAA